LNLILTPKMGITGAAIAWAVSLAVVNLAPIVQVGLFLRLRPPWGSGFVLVAMAAGACYGGLGLATRYALGMSADTFALFIVCASLIYLATLWRFRELLHLSQLLDGLRQRGRGSRAAVGAAQPVTE
jgi:hypothetical protein